MTGARVVTLTLAGEVFGYLQRKGGPVSLLALHNHFSPRGFSDRELTDSLIQLREEGLVFQDGVCWEALGKGSAA
jgi:hypothetical protein